jgi:hypothetical protein
MEYKFIIAYEVFSVLLALYAHLETAVYDSKGNIIDESYVTKWKQKL